MSPLNSSIHSSPIVTHDHDCSTPDHNTFNTPSTTPSSQQYHIINEDTSPEQDLSISTSDLEIQEHLSIADQSKIIRAKRNREAAYRSRTRNKIRQYVLEEQVQKQLDLNIQLKSLLQFLLTNLPKETLDKAKASMSASQSSVPFPVDLQPLTPPLTENSHQQLTNQTDDSHMSNHSDSIHSSESHHTDTDSRSSQV